MRHLFLAVAILLLAMPSYGAQLPVLPGDPGNKTSLDDNFTNIDLMFDEFYGFIDQGVKTTSNPSFLSLNVSGGNLAAANKQVTKAWATGLPYTADLTSVIYGGKHYICTTSHTAGSTTEPGEGADWADVWKIDSPESLEINQLVDVDTTGKATGKVLKFDASGNLIVGDDSVGTGSVPDGTVDQQILEWDTTTDAWIAVEPTDITAGAGIDITAGAISSVMKTASKATTYTIGTDDADEAYGGTIYVTSAATITAPAVTAGMNFTVATIGAIAVSLDVNAADRMYLDGTALADGDKATNTSTTGDTITCAYESSAGWFCWSGSPDGDHWTDGN